MLDVSIVSIVKNQRYSTNFVYLHTMIHIYVKIIQNLQHWAYKFLHHVVITENQPGTQV